jgi:hypothetical protein
MKDGSAIELVTLKKENKELNKTLNELLRSIEMLLDHDWKHTESLIQQGIETWYMSEGDVTTTGQRTFLKTDGSGDVLDQVNNWSLFICRYEDALEVNKKYCDTNTYVTSVLSNCRELDMQKVVSDIYISNIYRETLEYIEKNEDKKCQQV